MQKAFSYLCGVLHVKRTRSILPAYTVLIVLCLVHSVLLSLLCQVAECIWAESSYYLLETLQQWTSMAWHNASGFCWVDYLYLSHSYSIYHGTDYKIGLHLSVSLSVYLSVCEHSHGRISWSIFTKIGTDVKTPKKKNEFIRGQYHTTPSPILPHKTPILSQKVLKTHANIK